MVKCADCGLLGSQTVWTNMAGNMPPAGRIVEITSLTRTTGEWRHHPGDVLCLARVTQFPIDVRKEELLALLQRERECAEFTPWHQGFTPKEHQEMLEHERVRQWQAERENDDRRWREDQRKEERRWRLVELLVLGGFVTVVLVIAQIVAALIQR